MRKLKKFHENSTPYEWEDTFLVNEEDQRKKFSKDELNNLPTFIIVTYDKTYEHDIQQRHVKYENVYRLFDGDEISDDYRINLTFLMHKALKIMRENPDLVAEIYMVPDSSYDYDDVNGNFWPSDWIEEVGDTDKKKRRKERKLTSKGE